MQLQLQTKQLQPLLTLEEIRRAEEILRSCVHCGFCLATCPTYQLLGSELDSPRGRIYQIKRLLEGDHATRITQQHLDRCLGCRNCETTCPSGIRFSELLDIGRLITERTVSRPQRERVLRRLINTLVPERKRIAPLIQLGRIFRFPLARRLPTTSTRQPAPPPTPSSNGPHLILFQGCVQDGLSPSTNQQLGQLLRQLGYTIHTPQGEGCCGALSHHLSQQEDARQQMRNNMAIWLPLIEQHQARIVIAASGCGAMIQQYQKILTGEGDATTVSESVVDPIELLQEHTLQLSRNPNGPRKIAYHPPCSQQHGLHTDNAVESLLQKLGFELQPVGDRHLCCGAAGSYSILQSELSDQLRERKLKQLQHTSPELIVTANIGCQHHLQQKSAVPVVHWVELLQVTPR